MNIPILLGSTRTERKSDRVARYLERRMRDRGIDTHIIDLAEYDVPQLEAAVVKLESPSEDLLKLRGELTEADALVVVSPEYNAGMPGALKNALDHFFTEFRRMPIGVATVSSGDFGGVLVMQQLRLHFIRVGAVPVPAAFNVPRVQDRFTPEGESNDARTDTFADRFFDDLLWWTEAVMQKKAMDSEMNDG